MAPTSTRRRSPATSSCRSEFSRGFALAHALDVNLDTVQRAYRLLADEGLVIARVGRGTRIVDNVNRDEIDLRQHIADLVARAAAVGVSTRQLAEMVRSTPDTALA